MNASPAIAPLYTTEILRLASALPGARSLDRVDGEAELMSPTCGSRVRIAVQLDGERRVQAISQDVHACAFGQASAALLDGNAVGLSHSDAANALVRLSRWLAGEIDEAGWAGVEALAPARSRKARHAAILLPFRALVAAMEKSE